RKVAGDYRGALAASREAIRRSPLFGGAHALIGEILVHAGRIAEGLQRLDLAIRVEPTNPHPSREKALALALMGDRPGTEREIRRIEEVDPSGAILTRMRLFAWWEDREMARTTAELLGKHTSGASWESARPIIAAYGED